MKRRHFVFLTGATLTAPAHQWLIQEPGPLVSGLAGRRVSMELADRFMAMVGELRVMDDVAGGGTVLSLAEQQFGMVADLLDRASYDEPTGRKLHIALAERGQETPALLAELYIKQADALATLGDASGCAVVISKARTQVDRLTLDNEPSWLY